jgi:hypothetical protein
MISVRPNDRPVLTTETPYGLGRRASLLPTVWLAPEGRAPWFGSAIFMLVYFPGRYAFQFVFAREDLRALRQVHPEGPGRSLARGP